MCFVLEIKFIKLGGTTSSTLGGTGPDMHSSGTGPVTLFWGTILAWRAYFSLRGTQAVIWPGTAPKCSPLAPDLSGYSICYWNGRLKFDSRSDQTKNHKTWYSQLFCLTFSNKLGQWEASIVCGRQVADWLEHRKLFVPPPNQGNLVNKHVIIITIKDTIYAINFICSRKIK